MGIEMLWMLDSCKCRMSFFAFNVLALLLYRVKQMKLGKSELQKKVSNLTKFMQLYKYYFLWFSLLSTECMNLHYALYIMYLFIIC